MDSAKNELADKLKTANNILVTVSRNPSVDQLAACIGLTLLLNKMGKHAAAVFSGEVPSTIEFLQPEDTIEKNTDSLRDFIIALDKSKADKLRYKVEDNVVRIFITPYKTSISEADLEFSQGDFNVDVVVALGVQKQEDLDEAITSHGRILHDATVTSVNTMAEGGLGSINWRDPQASSLSELVTELAQVVGGNLLDTQIATALLTGIVAETNRFSNEKTSSQTMSASAALMAAGANQQLVASKLEQPPENNTDMPPEGGNPTPPTDGKPPKSSDGTLEIDHEGAIADDAVADMPTVEQPTDSMPELQLPDLETPTDNDTPADTIDESVNNDHLSPGSRLMTEAPSMGGVLTANSQPEGMGGTSDPLSQGDANAGPLLNHDGPITQPDPEPMPDLMSKPMEENVPEPTSVPMSEISVDPTPTPNFEPPAPLPQPEPPRPVTRPQPFISGLTPPPPAWVPPSDDPFNLGTSAVDDDAQTLSDIEQSVDSPHLQSSPDADAVSAAADPDTGLEAARDEVSKALNASSTAPGAIQALNAQPLGVDLHPSPMSSEPTAPVMQSPAMFSPSPAASQPTNNPFTTPGADSPMSVPSDEIIGSNPVVTDPTAPPPVPPPIPFQFRPPGQ